MAIQTRTRVTKGKAKNIDACADDRGIIRAAAMDQRGSLMREIGKQGGAGTPESLTEFKTAVTKALTPYATAILMDPEYGLPTLKAKAPNAGVLLAYERSGYDADPENRMPDVLDRWTVRRLVDAGANGIKVLIYYDPFDDKDLNLRKEIVIERIGAECAANDVPLFVEPLAYKKGMDEKGLEFAKRKPDAVKKYMATFSEARFGIGLALRELEALLVHPLLIRERLDEERDVVRGALGADPLDHDLLAQVEILVVERVVIDEDFDPIRAGVDQSANGPAVEDVGHAIFRVGVVARPLVREEDAGIRRLRPKGRKPVLGVHEDRRRVRRQRPGHGRLELGERLGRAGAALLADLAHQRPALIHRRGADDAALIGARVDVLRLALGHPRSCLNSHDDLPCKLRTRGLVGIRVSAEVLFRRATSE